MYIEHSVNVFDIDMFALLGCYAAHIGSYWRFGTTYRSSFQGSIIPEFVTLDGGTDMLYRNVGSYQSALLKIPEDRRCNWHRCGLHENHTVPKPHSAETTQCQNHAVPKPHSAKTLPKPHSAKTTQCRNHSTPFLQSCPENFKFFFESEDFFRLAYTHTKSGNWLLRWKQNRRYREPSSDSCLLLYTLLCGLPSLLTL